MPKDICEKLVCMGYSMKPTLLPLDELTIVPYKDSPISAGDVIVFVPPGKDHKIAHRVISAKPGKILTKGDNNVKSDTVLVLPQNILGKVVRYKRGSKISRVYGGSLGYLHASVFRAKQLSGRIMSILFGSAYRRLARSGIVLRLVPAHKKIRTLVFKRPHGEDIQVFMGNLLVARRRPRADKWYVRKPFRLFVEKNVNKDLYA